MRLFFCGRSDGSGATGGVALPAGSDSFTPNRKKRCGQAGRCPRPCTAGRGNHTTFFFGQMRSLVDEAESIPASGAVCQTGQDRQCDSGLPGNPGGHGNTGIAA
ncbi:hypothetical protein DESC_480172 [Desulfosarcina cetonica]|nr:hypothetical protein DESC_480172 [Desulfosarcina cetonica]